MKQSIKYSAVSLLATAADFSVFRLLENIMASHHALCTFLGMLVGAMISWNLLCYWVFEVSKENKWHQRKKFVTGQILCIALNTGFMALLADFLNFPRMPSRVAIALWVWLVLYYFNKKVVFKA